MNDDNVVPFDPLARGGMARRGAPDKNGGGSADALVLECPSCFVELRLAAEWLEGETAVLCGRCGTKISLSGARRAGGSEEAFSALR